MSLKWYPNARIDETQEAYGKTWRVDKVEHDGAIVFRCGKDTAMAPRTDSPKQVINHAGAQFGRVSSSQPNIAPSQAAWHRQSEDRRRQAEAADKMQKAMSEALAGVGAKLLVHDCYTCDVDMKDVDDRIKSFIGGMDPKSDLSNATLVDYAVFKGWAEKGWTGI